MKRVKQIQTDMSACSFAQSVYFVAVTFLPCSCYYKISMFSPYPTFTLSRSYHQSVHTAPEILLCCHLKAIQSEEVLVHG
jgi:hypothetical protein